MRPDEAMDRLQRNGSGADLIGERRQADVDAFPGIALGLTIQGLMLAELLEQCPPSTPMRQNWFN